MCGRYHLSGSAAAQAAEILADPDLSLELRLMAVSYTHLDVYKRQGLWLAVTIIP